MTRILSALACLIVATACITNHEQTRSPGEAEVKAQNEKNAFYTASLPVDKRLSLGRVNAATTQALSDCEKTEYAKWMRPMKTFEAETARDAYLLKKLSRTFNFAQIETPEKSYIGDAKDFQEFICATASMSEGVLNGPLKVGASFMTDLLQSPKINAPVLTMILRGWNYERRDSATALALINHPNVDKYVIKEMIQYMAHNYFDPELRVSLTDAMLDSKVFTSNAGFLGDIFVDETRAFSAANATAIFKKLLVKAPSAVPASKLLTVALAKPDTAQDADVFYEPALIDSKNQVEVLLQVLYSAAPFAKSESEFLRLWNAKLPQAQVELLADYNADTASSLHRLSKATVYRVLAESLRLPHPTAGLRSTALDFVREAAHFDTAQSEAIFRAVCEGPTDAIEVTRELLEQHMFVAYEDPSKADKFASCLRKNSLKFITDKQVINLYADYIARLTDKAKEMILVTELLDHSGVNNPYLAQFAQDASEQRSSKTKLIFKKLIEYSSLNAETLDQISIIVSNPASFVNDKDLLEAIDRHPLATRQIVDRDRSGRQPASSRY